MYLIVSCRSNRLLWGVTNNFLDKVEEEQRGIGQNRACYYRQNSFRGIFSAEIKQVSHDVGGRIHELKLRTIKIPS